jgi:hypothetical protein
MARGEFWRWRSLIARDLAEGFENQRGGDEQPAGAILHGGVNLVQGVALLWQTTAEDQGAPGKEHNENPNQPNTVFAGLHYGGGRRGRGIRSGNDGGREAVTMGTGHLATGHGDIKLNGLTTFSASAGDVHGFMRSTVLVGFETDLLPT